MRHPISIKMYESVSPAADFVAIEREIRHYQFLSRINIRETCFMQYYGCYKEGHSLNLVMDHYEKNLIALITETARNHYELNEETLVVIVSKLMPSFIEMELRNIAWRY